MRNDHPWSRRARENATDKRRDANLKKWAKAAGCSFDEYVRRRAAGEFWCYKHGWTISPPSKLVCRVCKQEYERFYHSSSARALRERRDVPVHERTDNSRDDNS